MDFIVIHLPCNQKINCATNKIIIMGKYLYELNQEESRNILGGDNSYKWVFLDGRFVQVPINS